jgi:transposase InsO family protein
VRPPGDQPWTGPAGRDRAASPLDDLEGALAARPLASRPRCTAELPPLRVVTARRATPHGRQEAGPLQRARPPANWITRRRTATEAPATTTSTASSTTTAASPTSSFTRTKTPTQTHARASSTNSNTRARSLQSFVRYYNRQRPHSSLGDPPPISRIHKRLRAGQLELIRRDPSLYGHARGGGVARSCGSRIGSG